MMNGGVNKLYSNNCVLIEVSGTTVKKQKMKRKEIEKKVNRPIDDLSVVQGYWSLKTSKKCMLLVEEKKIQIVVDTHTSHQ